MVLAICMWFFSLIYLFLFIGKVTFTIEISTGGAFVCLPIHIYLVLFATPVPVAWPQKPANCTKTFCNELHVLSCRFTSERTDLPAARKPLEASLQGEDTASPQKLPANGSSVLTLEICCPHGIHLACDDFSVSSSEHHQVQGRSDDSTTTSLHWLNVPPITRVMPGRWAKQRSHISVTSSEPRDRYLWNRSLFLCCPGYHIHLQDELLWQLNLGLGMKASLCKPVLALPVIWLGYSWPQKMEEVQGFFACCSATYHWGCQNDFCP